VDRMSRPKNRPRIFVTQPVCDSATKRLRALGSVKIFPMTAASCPSPG
jgi:hypothetical protein